jgi:hypothetical protein
MRPGGRCISVLLFFLVILPAFLHAQSAAEMDALLETRALSYGQAAYVILNGAGGGDLSPGAAFAAAQDKGWLPPGAAPGDTAGLGTVSLLIMRSFNLKGGFMYTLFHSPRHALRELTHLGIIRERMDPAGAVSGEKLLEILGEVLTLTNEGGSQFE